MALAALFLALLYGTSAALKSRSTESFRRYLEPIGGELSGHLLKLTLLVEASLALGFLVGLVVAPVVEVAGTSSACFLVLATVVHGSLMVQGQGTSCNCFGELSHEEDTSYAAVQPALFATRNAILVAVSVWVAGGDLTIAAVGAAAIASIIGVCLSASIWRERIWLRADLHPKSADFARTIADLQAFSWWVNGHPRSF